MILAILTHWRWIVGGLGLVAIVALYAAWSNTAAQRDAAETEVRAIEAQLAAAMRREAAIEKAATERAADTRDLTDLEKGLTNAIDKAARDDAPVGPATRALGCERLLRAGQTASAEYRRQCD